GRTGALQADCPEWRAAPSANWKGPGEASTSDGSRGPHDRPVPLPAGTLRRCAPTAAVYGPQTHRKEKTVVIDECSMLTMDDLYAVLQALDLGHVERLILVGDPNQLPPIGVGRPFADLVGVLDNPADDVERAAAEVRARLTIEVRTSLGAPSDAL